MISYRVRVSHAEELERLCRRKPKTQAIARTVTRELGHCVLRIDVELFRQYVALAPIKWAAYATTSNSRG